MPLLFKVCYLLKLNFIKQIKSKLPIITFFLAFFTFGAVTKVENRNSEAKNQDFFKPRSITRILKAGYLIGVQFLQNYFRAAWSKNSIFICQDYYILLSVNTRLETIWIWQWMIIFGYWQ